jgi:alpha/beta superfamily hydrolase
VWAVVAGGGKWNEVCGEVVDEASAVKWMWEWNRHDEDFAGLDSESLGVCEITASVEQGPWAISSKILWQVCSFLFLGRTRVKEMNI